MMALYGTALVPDFREHYGLSLVGAARELNPVELVLLIDGLPEDSRFMARASGERAGRAWTRSEWLLLDMRTAMEGLRATVAGALSKSAKAGQFREWKAYPGAEAQRLAARRRKLNSYFAMATPLN